VVEHRTLRADALRNRAKVLAAAGTAFAADGVSVSVDEIARLAGVGPGTVYRHFPTKEALFAAVVFDRLQTLAQEAEALDSAADPGQALFAFIGRLMAEAGPKRDLIDGLERAGVQVPGDLADAGDLAEAGARIRRGIGRLLARAQEDGAVRADVSLDELMALLSGILLAAQRRGPAIAPERAADILCAGLSRADRPGS
jgi:AcrR family transcriptional regulator